MPTDVAASARTSRVEMRLSPVAKSLIEQAAAARHTSVTDFMLGSSLRAAYDTLADKTVFLANDAQWAEFNARLDAAPVHNQGLEDLAALSPDWDL